MWFAPRFVEMCSIEEQVLDVSKANKSKHSYMPAALDSFREPGSEPGSDLPVIGLQGTKFGKP